MKICIITQPLHSNYGGLLQAYALQKTLKEMGHNVVTDRDGYRRYIPLFYRIARIPYYIFKRYITKDKRYNIYKLIYQKESKQERANKEYISSNTQRFVNSHISNIQLFNGKKDKINSPLLHTFDAIIVGSDQVWRPCYSHIPTYFLDFATKLEIKKIAYAASFGIDNWGEFSPKLTMRCSALINQFNAVSVREDSGVKLCQQHLHKDVVHVLDPTLLLEKEDYQILLEESEQKTESKMMMCYILDRTCDKQEVVNRLSKMLGLMPIEVMPKQKFTAETSQKDLPICVFPSVSKWISAFRDAEFVVTDSFHGTVFSIIFNKPFIAIGNNGRGLTRFTSLLKIFDLEKRLISNYDNIEQIIGSEIDWKKVNQIKKEWKMSSINFIVSALQ